MHLEKFCSREKFITYNICAQSCSDIGCDYANCCPPSPPLQLTAPTSPSPPAPPPPIKAIEYADDDRTKEIKGEKNGFAMSSQQNRTCIVDGIKTVISGPCPPGSGRRLSVPTRALLCPVLPAGNTTRRSLRVQDYVVLEPGEILNLSAIPVGVNEVRLVGGGEKPFEAVDGGTVEAGRTLTITTVGDARVKINATGELTEVSGTLRLSGVDIFREPFDDGCDGGCVGFLPLLDIREGGSVEIVESELRVVAGELVVALKGSLILREATIAGAPFDKLDEFALDLSPVTAMSLQGSAGAAQFITGVERGLRVHHCSPPEVFFQGECQ